MKGLFGHIGKGFANILEAFYLLNTKINIINLSPHKDSILLFWGYVL